MDASRETYDGIRKEIEAIDARTKELSEALEKLHAVADEVHICEHLRLCCYVLIL